MNIDIEKTPAIVLESKHLERFTDLEALGLYTFTKMLIDQELTITLPMIIERAAQQFNVDEQHILRKIKVMSELGVLFKAKKD